MLSLFFMAICNGMLLSLVVGVVAQLFGYRLPPIGFLLALIILLVSAPFALTVDGASQRENTQRLEAWSANSCVAPSTVAQSVFVASEEEFGLVGTGFMLEGGIAVTNQHVAEALVDGALFRTPDGTHYQGALYYQAPSGSSDVAFYDLTGACGVPALPLAAANPQAGEALLVVGNYGARERFHPSVVYVIDVAPGNSIQGAPYSALTRALLFAPQTIGKVLRSLLSGGEAPPLQARPTEISFNGDVGAGNSGSPIVNCQGEVVGVLFAGRAFYLDASEQTAYGVSLDSLKAELERAADPVEGDSTT